MRIVYLLLLLFFTTTKAYSEDDPLEQLVKMTPNQLLEVKIHQVLKKRKVMRPEYYAKLIAHSTYTVKEKKMAVALLGPESRGDAKARNRRSGASGAWQVMPAWKKRLKIRGSLFDPPVCLDAAMQVWNIHLADARGSDRAALVAYSGGAKGYPDKIFSIVKELS